MIDAILLGKYYVFTDVFAHSFETVLEISPSLRLDTNVIHILYPFLSFFVAEGTAGPRARLIVEAP